MQDTSAGHLIGTPSNRLEQGTPSKRLQQGTLNTTTPYQDGFHDAAVVTCAFSQAEARRSSSRSQAFDLEKKGSCMGVMHTDGRHQGSFKPSAISHNPLRVAPRSRPITAAGSPELASFVTRPHCNHVSIVILYCINN